jgi:outer membrane protein assembly factor BamB
MTLTLHRTHYQPYSAGFLLLVMSLCALAQPQPGTVLWTYDATWPIVSAPVIGPAGTIYIGTDYGLHAVTNAGGFGSNQWIFPEYRTRGATVATDGTIYLASDSQNFYALNPDGSVKWTYVFASYGSCPPAIGFDNTIYVVGNGALNALTATGAKKWAFPIWGEKGLPVIGADGTIYVRNDQSPATLFAVDPKGGMKWSVSFGHGSQYASDAPAIGSDGTIYVYGGALHAFRQDGTLLWSSQNREFGFSPVVGPGGGLYVSSYSGNALYSLRPTGETNWQVNFPLNCVWHACFPPRSPAVDASGTLYHCASNSVVAISSEGQVQWVVSLSAWTGPPIDGTSPAIGEDGVVYGTISNMLYAIAGTNKLADSSWPMYRQNARHTGKVEKPAIDRPQVRNDRNFQFQLHAQIDRIQTIEISTNLVGWVALTNVLVTNVPMDVVDLSASNYPSRYYRTVSP